MSKKTNFLLSSFFGFEKNVYFLDFDNAKRKNQTKYITFVNFHLFQLKPRLFGTVLQLILKVTVCIQNDEKHVDALRESLEYVIQKMFEGEVFIQLKKINPTCHHVSFQIEQAEFKCNISDHRKVYRWCIHLYQEELGY